MDSPVDPKNEEDRKRASDSSSEQEGILRMYTEKELLPFLQTPSLPSIVNKRSNKLD